MIKTCILLLLASPFFAQDLVNSIIEKNPFDPDRGQKPEEVVENVEEPLPADLPVCDGTLILGENRYAMFTFQVEGKMVSECLEVQERSNGYLVKQIESDRVILEQGGNTHTIKLFFQDAKKDKKGGSRKSVAPPREPVIQKLPTPTPEKDTKKVKKEIQPRKIQRIPPSTDSKPTRKKDF